MASGAGEVKDAEWLQQEEVTVAIVGGGLGGICAGLYLEKAGIGPFVIFEKSDEPGGVWSANTYPGCACDIPAHLYSFAIEPEMDWSVRYPPQHEILSYVKKIVAKHGWEERRVLRLGSSVEETRWSEDSQRWEVAVRSPGRAEAVVIHAKYLVVATGTLIEPMIPEVEGLDKFKGKSMHTARYDHSVGLKGKRVAVVGTGASAIQVVPSVAPEVGQLTVFMRTPPWILPKPDCVFSQATVRLLRWKWPRQIYRNAIYRLLERYGPSLTQRGSRWARWEKRIAARVVTRWRESLIKDPDLRAALTPKYEMGCKRVLLSDSFYQSLSRDNVTLVASGVTGVTEKGLVDEQGREHEVDVIIWATGFNVPAMWTQTRVFGRGGKSWIELLGGKLKSSYLGMSAPGLPNFLQIQGPNQWLGHNSLVLLMEAQCRYFTELISKAESVGASTVEVDEAAHHAFAQEMRARLADSVWQAGGCRSWYLDVNGADTDLIWPGSADEYLSRTRRVDMRKWALRDEVGKPLRYKGPGGHFGRRLAGLSSLLPEAK